MLNNIERFVICFVILFFIKTGCTPSTETEKIAHDEQFVEIHLQYSFVDELNTFEGTFTKDLVMDGSVTLEFWLSKDDQESIMELAEQVSFFSLPNTILPTPGVSIAPDPSPDRLRIKSGDVGNTVNWSYPGDPENKDFKNVIELSNYIMSIVRNTEIYKALPEARGGRL